MIVFIRYDLLAHDSFQCTTARRRLNIILYLYVLDYDVYVYIMWVCFMHHIKLFPLYIFRKKCIYHIYESNFSSFDQAT